MNKVIVLAVVAMLAVGMTSCCRSCRKAKPVEVKGAKWGLLELNDKVIDRVLEGRPERFTLTLGEDGRVGGRGDCNTYFAGYSLEGTSINIANIASTRMLCPDQSLEDRYFRMLESAVQIKIDGNFLILMDKEGKIIASFEKINN